VISINGVDMNIDEYLAFSLAAAAAAQEDAAAHDNTMEHEDHEQELQGQEDNGMDQGEQDPDGANTGFGHFDENENGIPDTPIASIQSFSHSNTADTPIVIDPALEQYTLPARAEPQKESSDLPIDVDVHDTPAQSQAIPVPNQPPAANENDPMEPQPSADTQHEQGDKSEPGRPAEATPAPLDEPSAMDVDFDDDEDDGDFVPENEIGGVQGEEAREDDDEPQTSPAADAMPAQTQDSMVAQATQGPPELEEEQDDEDDDDDEYFRIEEADYEDLFQPIEDVPIPVEDYLEIQAQYQRHLEEFNATLLRQQVAEMIANEDATGSDRAAPSTGVDGGDAAEAARQRQAYQDTLESLGIAPEASQQQ
jgi:hypothetical protein